MTDQLDAVARAAKQAYDNYVSSTLGETRWTAEWIAESWRVIARAAIDALGLTEEWRCIGWVSTSTEKTAWLQRQSNGGEVQARLVSPWVRKDSSDE